MKKRLALFLFSLLAMAMGWAQPVQTVEAPLWAQPVQTLAVQSAQAAFGAGMRIEVIAGTLDPRLKLAPCRQVTPYLPPGQPAWGRTRVGLRCTEGAVPWNVYLPLTVKVFAPALTAAQALPAGTVLLAEHLHMAEVDWAGADSPTLSVATQALGRTLVRHLPAGSALREADLKKRLMFNTGDPVRVTAAGSGFSVSGEGMALTPGVEGQPARVRTEAGRTVTGLAVAERRIEVAL